MRDFTGKTAMITGGASGIGYGLAEALVQAGANVAICDLDLAPAATLGERDNVKLIKLDVADAVQWDQATSEVEAELGPVQLLFNNAGVSPPEFASTQARFDEQTLEEWLWVVQVNLAGVFYGIRTVLPRLRARGLEGHIINTSSMAGVLPFPGMSPSYAATKSGVLGLSEQLRLDLHLRGPANVGVSVIFPGHTRTRISDTSIAHAPTPFEGGTQSDFATSVRSRLEKGTDPALMAERILRGVRRGEFYIFTHPEYRPLVERRMNDLCAAFAEAADPARSDPMPAQVSD